MDFETRKIIIDSRIIKHLGSDLITSSDVAVTELVKNSIDAQNHNDYKYVNMYLYNSLFTLKEKFGNISSVDMVEKLLPSRYSNLPVFVIEDYGIGMNEKQLTNGFLTIGTNIKSNTEEITLGEKGIGRLAAQRLGPALVVETASQDNSQLTQFAYIDWEKVIKGENDISYIKSFLGSANSYTRLWIFGVDVSSFVETTDQLMLEDDSIIFECNKDLKSSLNFLVSPFEKGTNQTDVSFEYEGHKVDVSFSDKMIDLSESTHYFNCETIDGKLTLSYGLKLTPWYIERVHLAAVKSEAFKRLRKSHKFYEDLLKKSDQRIRRVLDKKLCEEEIKKALKEAYAVFMPCSRESMAERYEEMWHNYAINALRYLSELSPLKGEIYSYKQNAAIGKDIIINAFIDQKKRNGLWNESDVSTYTLPKLKDFLENYNGIKLYRNCYRIGFLGDKENDWIKLQQFRTKGQQWYRFDLGNTVGFVSLNDPYQLKIKEISSRLDIQSGPHADAFKLFINIIFNELFYELNRAADAVVKTILEEEGLLIDSISKRVKKNSSAINKIISQNKKMLTMIGKASDELLAEATHSGESIIIPQARFIKASSLLEDINKQAEENVAVSSETAQLLAEANEQLKVIEVESYNNFKLMANGLITETITHELHSVSKTSIDSTIPEHFEFLKTYFKNSGVIPEYNTHVYPIKNGYESILSKIMGVSDLYSFLETTFIKKGTYGQFVSQSISEVVEDVYKNLMKSNTLKTVSLRHDCEGTIWITPKGVLVHVFYNLFSNALYWINKRREYATHDPKYLNEDEDQIVIEPYGQNEIIVYDTGTGVMPEMQDILFEALQSGKPNNEGRGMGLYIVRQLMKSFGGNIYLLDELNAYGNKYKFLITLNEE